MTYVLYGATLAFTWFLALNLLLSVLVAAIPRRVSKTLGSFGPAMRARLLLALRLLPAASSIAFVVGVFLPSFWTLEPRDFDEAFGFTTTTFAIVACMVLGTALWRGVSALRESSGRSRAWLAHATPMALAGAPAPVYCLDAPVPAMTLVGVIRPRLLVTRPLIEALTPEELRAAVEHEVGHLGSWDNLKRLVMRATPDALSLFPASRRIERDWALAAEHAADAQAAQDSGTGLALASALVKVARLTPIDRSFGVLASPLVGGEGIASRVERLVDRPPAHRLALATRILCWAAAAASLAIVVAGYAPLLQSVHSISEVLVHTLP
ncbi:MAG TPA: M48 family metalloprotease [Vicinamibacterales bacterium]|jgi:Zn-dependent protease with chaperone function|nr:M48 family metalloprotease [Vicinamibacterales bacterium]